MLTVRKILVNVPIHVHVVTKAFLGGMHSRVCRILSVTLFALKRTGADLA